MRNSRHSRPLVSFRSNLKKATKAPRPGIPGRRTVEAGSLQPLSAADTLGLACRPIVESLEQRQLLSVTPQPAGPVAIGVNFVGGGNSGTGTALSASDVAGAVVKTANYNNETTKAGTRAPLSDSNGNALNTVNGYAQPATVTYTSAGTYDSVKGAPTYVLTDGDHKLNYGFIDGDSTVDIPGVPYTHFDLYVYEVNDSSGRVEQTTLTSLPSTNAALSPSPVYGKAVTPTDTSHEQAPAGGWVYTQATDTAGTGTTNADYAAFLGLAPDPAGDGGTAANGVSFKTHALTSNGYLNGFQIVDDPWQGDTITPPTLNPAANGPGSVILSWMPSPDAFSYTVYRQGPGDTQPVAIATGLTGLTYTDTGLTNGQTYNYTVSADVAFTRDSSGNALSAPVNSFTMSNQVTGSPTVAAPATPTNVTTQATNNNTNVTVSWSPVEFATSYIVQRATSPGGPYTVISPSGGVTSGTSFVDTGASPNTLTPGQTYYYQVLATNSGGNSAPSAAVAGNLAVTGTGDGWTGAFFAGSNTSTTPFNPDPSVNNANNAVFTHLDPVIQESAATNANTLPTGAPANFNGGSDAHFSAIWEGDLQAQYNEQYTLYPTSDDGVRLYVDTTPNDPSPNPANAVILDDKLTTARGAAEDTVPVVDASGNPVIFQAGAKYHVWMAYENQTGNWDAELRWGSKSTPKQLIPSTQVYADVPPQVAGTPNPTAPPSGPPIATPNNQAIQISWVSEAADTYNIYRSTTPGGEGTTPYKTGVTGNSFTDTGLTNGSTYYYTVAGVSTKGLGPQSAEVSSVPVVTTPNVPTGVAAALGAPATPETLGGSVPAVPITVSFPAVPFADSYNILRAPVSNGTAGTFTQIATGVTGTGSTVTYTDTAAIGTTDYQYEVQAVNAAGTSAASAPTATVSLTTGVTQQFYAGTQTWGNASDNSDTKITGVVSNPTTTSFQPQINFSTSSGTAVPPGGTVPTTYSTILTGKVHITTGGDYTFAASTDDHGVLYVDGTLVAVGTYNTPTAGGWTGTNVYSNNVDLNLAPGDYDFQFFQEQGTGGQRFQMYYQGPDTIPAGGTVGNPVIVPTTALKPLTGAPAAATNVTAAAPVLNASGTNYSVTVSFQDNATNELEYQLQRSTDPNFVAAVVNIASTGLNDNGVPQAGGAAATPTVSLTDPSAPAGSTFYYRVVALNFEGTTTSTPTTAVTTGLAANAAGVEANYFNNEWWKSTNQSTSAPEVGGVGSQANRLALTSDESASLAVIDAHGNATSGAGPIVTSGNTPNAMYPDPNSAIGPTNFSTVFTGAVNILTGSTAGDATTNYTFYLTSDDDGYLYVDDQLVAADPGGHGPEDPTALNTTTGLPSGYPVRGTAGQPGSTVQPVPIALSAGKHNVEFFQSNGGGGWDFHLYYKGPDTAASGTTGVIVPTGNPADNSVAGLTSQMSPLVAPTGVTATGASTDGTKATITWNNNNTSAVRYVIQRSTDQTFPAASTTTFDAGLGTSSPDATTGAPTTGTLSYSDSGLALNTTYYYRVAAQNFDGTGPFTAVGPTSTLTTANQLPQVTPVTATELPNNQVAVSFPASSVQQSVTGYQIQRTDVTAGGAPQTIATIPPSMAAVQAGYTYTDSSTLSSGHTYTYQVVAQNTSGSGPANSVSTTSNNLLYVTGAQPANHPTGFAGATDLTLHNGTGSAPAITASGQLQLTDAATVSTANSAYETAPVSINGPFSSTFDFQFVSPVADGFAFVIQNAGPTATGGNGASKGYAGITGQSLAVVFNMYNNVTQVALGTNGTIGTYQNMTSLGNGTSTGGAFHQLSGTNTDVFQATISLDPTNDTTTGAVLHLAVRDTTTGYGYATDFTLPANAVSGSALFGANSQDYIGFTGATGGSTATQYINDWVFNNSAAVVVTPPTLSSIGITDNPTAATVTTANQRSQVRGLVLTFSQPDPTFSASQLSLSVYPGTDTTGTPTALTGVFGTPTTADGGTTWVVPFVSGTANTSASGSLNDGIYSLSITGVNSSGITSLTFHRLYGDVDGNKTVNPADYARLKTSFGSSVGQSGYNPDLDYDNNGTINPADYAQFKTRFGKTFTYT